MEREIWIEKRSKGDLYAKPLGKSVLFQNQRMYKCRRLSQWICWGDYLVKWQDALWYYGYNEKVITRLLDIQEIRDIINKYIGDKPFYDAVKEAEKYTESKTDNFRGCKGAELNRVRWHFAQIYKKSREEMDKLTDEEIYKMW